jgi:hypothetical protein
MSPDTILGQGFRSQPPDIHDGVLICLQAAEVASWKCHFGKLIAPRILNASPYDGDILVRVEGGEERYVTRASRRRENPCGLRLRDPDRTSRTAPSLVIKVAKGD